jgi:hypothetical protein
LLAKKLGAIGCPHAGIVAIALGGAVLAGPDISMLMFKGVDKVLGVSDERVEEGVTDSHGARMIVGRLRGCLTVTATGRSREGSCLEWRVCLRDSQWRKVMRVERDLSQCLC